jgi:AAA family ATP:ADP antiporter
MALVGLASVAVPLAVLWGVLGLWLGRRQESMLASARERAPADAPASAAPFPAR